MTKVETGVCSGASFIAVKIGERNIARIFVTWVHQVDAQVADCLSERMVLTKIVSVVGEINVKKAAREDILMAVIRVQ